MIFHWFCPDFVIEMQIYEWGYSNEKNNELRGLEETSHDTLRSIYLSKFSGRNHYKGRNLSG